jgi:hypothetical protein
MEEIVLSPQDTGLEEIRQELAEQISRLRTRLIHLAAGGDDFLDQDQVRITLLMPAQLLADPEIRAAAEALGRIGRKARFQLRLLYDRPLEKLMLADFGSFLLRSIAASNPEAVLIEDSTGRTLQDLVGPRG